jgi:SAM-dependent methyltransferase
MKNSAYQVLKQLKDDFTYYAAKCLKIVDKETGQMTPFVLNRAQMHIHKQIEEQKRRIGKVRVVIVKGRQQGCCYTPEMRVLTSDYRWVKLKHIHPGDTLVGVDETLGAKNKAGRHTERRIRKAVVEGVSYQIAQTYDIKLSNGVVLRATAGHRHLCQRRSGVETEWREVKDTRPGDRIRLMSHPPEKEKIDFDDGWFSGLLDGEGSFGANPQVRIGVCQREGGVLQRARDYLIKHNIHFYEQADRRPMGFNSKRGPREVFTLRVDCLVDIIRLLVRTRPVRFTHQFLFENKKLPKTSQSFSSWATVESIEPGCVRNVIDLQTSHKTFICEGVVSHNSTYTAGRFFHKATLNPGSTVFILAHMADSTNHLFGMAKRFYETAPPPILPTIDKMNERRLEFNAINSSYAVGTAGSAQIGRGTTVRYFHGSEAGYWENADDIAAGVLQAVPNAPGTEIIIESTANGAGNWFHNKAMSGLDTDSDGDFITIFTPWYWQPEYRKTPPKSFTRTEEEDEIARMFNLDNEQLFWRRGVILDAFGGDVWRFKREYPNTVEEGFSASGTALIHISYILDARRCQLKDPFSPVVGGCDPARTRDRTVMVLRRGREIIKHKKYSTMDEMTCAGIIANDIEKYNIVKYFVDVGCGYGTVDRLKELGYGGVVTGVHFGGTALEPDIYANKSAEMADAVKTWFEEGNCNIPDDDAFQADIVAIPPLLQRGSRGKLALPPKDEIKKQLGRSPDIFDALKLTFAFPVARNASGQRIRRVTLDTRRPGSPLSTVHDFNHTNNKKHTTFSQDFKIQ